jgi:hypothetical protein
MKDFSRLPLTCGRAAKTRQGRREAVRSPKPELCSNKNHIAAKICGFADSSNHE